MKDGIQFEKEKRRSNNSFQHSRILAYVANVSDQKDSFEMHYEDENIWLTQKMMTTLYMWMFI